MVRPLILAAAVLALATPAIAQAPRDHLPSINGVAFGEAFERARGVLGAKFEEGTAADDKMTNILMGSAPLFGESFQITYAFGDGGRLDTAEAVAELDTTDFAACKTHWAKVRENLVAALGKPDASDDKTTASPPVASATFDYKDGAEIHAAMLGCLIQVNWAARPPKG